MYRLLAMDVDGTLTDGGVYMDGTGNEFKRFDIQDGLGIVRFRKSGGVVAFISGRYSLSTKGRAENLRVDYLFNGVDDKLPVLRALVEELGIAPSEVVYAGDDLNDLECIGWAGLGVAVANAVDEVKEAADMVTVRSGGYGAIRELAEFVMRCNLSE